MEQVIVRHWVPGEPQVQWPGSIANQGIGLVEANWQKEKVNPKDDSKDTEGKEKPDKQFSVGPQPINECPGGAGQKPRQRPDGFLNPSLETAPEKTRQQSGQTETGSDESQPRQNSREVARKGIGFAPHMVGVRGHPVDSLEDRLVRDEGERKTGEGEAGRSTRDYQSEIVGRPAPDDIPPPVTSRFIKPPVSFSHHWPVS